MRRGFTLIELMVAGMMTTIVLGGITTSLSQLGSAKSVSRQRLEAFSRCDAALRILRKDIITVLRRDDLFDTRVLITDDSSTFQGREVDRDELLVFNGYLRANKEIDFNGEGLEYETQFRIEENDISSALWKRRDAILDDNPIGGGMAIPIADGIISLQLEAFDGVTWFGQWDSDDFGIPMAIRITVMATGMSYKDEYTSLVTLRTIVPLDRFMPPADLLEIEEETAGEDGLSGDGGVDLGGGGTDGSGGTDGGGGTGGSGGTGGAGGTGAGGGTGGTRPGGSGSKGGSGTKGNPSGTGSSLGNTITDPDGNVHEIPQ